MPASTDNQPLLIDLLTHADTAIRIYDMGRRISKLSTSQFARIERQEIPYPAPYMHEAYLGLVLWNPANASENAIWFLRLPLDERGFLAQAARDDLVNRLLQNASNQQNGMLEGEDALKDNPFVFKPDTEKMAMFHALASRAMKRTPSQGCADAAAYLKGERDTSDWQELALQGIADALLVLKDDHHAALAKRIAEMPDAPLATLCTQLEHIQPATDICAVLEQRIKPLLTDSSASLQLAALLRGISNSADMELKNGIIDTLLTTAHSQEAEIAVVIATRFTDQLRSPQRLHPFLEQLATSKAGQAGFSRLVAELMFMPDLRALIMVAFRSPNRSEALSAAIGQMFGDHFTAPTLH